MHCKRCRRRACEPWARKVPWRRKRNPPRCPCLESPTDRGAWRATAREVAKSRTRLSTRDHSKGNSVSNGSFQGTQLGSSRTSGASHDPCSLSRVSPGTQTPPQPAAADWACMQGCMTSCSHKGVETALPPAPTSGPC